MDIDIRPAIDILRQAVYAVAILAIAIPVACWWQRRAA